MHFYKKNIGDYAKKAGRLSMLQHGAYTLLMDSCYDREEFPTREDAIEWTWASSREEIEAVEFVLRKFFTLEDGRYVQNRIQEELEEYRAKAETNKRIAIDRETKRKEKGTKRARTVDDAQLSGDEPPPNHKPLTTNQELAANSAPIGAGDKSPPNGLTANEALFQVAVPWLVANGCKESGIRSLLGGAIKQIGAESAWSLASECMSAISGSGRKANTKPSRHGGFDLLDYTEGVTADGRIA